MVKSLASYSRLCCAYFAAIGVVFACAVIGCGESEILVAPVHGTITVDGKPLAGGRIMFAPQPNGENIEPGKPAYGRLDEEGRFELTTFSDGDGAVVGTHLVTITAPRDASPAQHLGFRSLLVPKAMEVKLTGVNQIDISLTAADVAKYSR